MPLCPIFAFQDSYQQIRICDVPKKIGDWSIKRVEVECQFPDNKVGKFDCSLIGGVWATTISACSTAGTTTNGFVVNGYDENGNKYVLGKSDLYIMTNESRIVPQKELLVVNILPNKPDIPHVGDIVFVDGKFEIYDGENWISTGSSVIESETHKGWAQNSDFANESNWAVDAGAVDWENVENKPTIPTKTSELENDSGFITVEDVPDNTKLFNDTKTRYIDGNGNIYEYLSEPTVKWVFSDGWKRELKEYSKDGVTFRYYFVGLYPYSTHPEVHIYSNESWKTDEERDAITQLTFNEFSDFEFPSVSATKVTMNGWSNVGVIADKDFVNSSIATNTANFWGTYVSNVGWPTEATNNDYLFWKTVDENGNTIYKRYKYIASTSTWTYEYTLNNSSFTAEQWATINGGPYATQTSLNDKQDKLPYNDVWDVYDVGCWNAVNATRDVNGNDIDKTYATKEELNNAIEMLLTKMANSKIEDLK